MPPPILLNLCALRHIDEGHQHDLDRTRTSQAAECCSALVVYRDIHACAVPHIDLFSPPFYPNVFSSHVLSYGQFSRVVCDQFLLLSQGDVSITLTASGAGGEAFSDLALLSVELESEDVRKAM